MRPRLRFFHVLLAHMCSGLMMAQPGTLDVSFGNNGLVPFLPYPDVTTYYQNGSVVVQPDGRILVSGSCLGNNLLTKGYMARFLPDGTADPSFGTNGIVHVVPPSGRIMVYNMALQPDGRIILAGARGSGADAVTLDTWFARFNVDGSVDSGFGVGGSRTMSTSTAADYAVDVDLDANGGIVGYGPSGPSWDRPACMYRLTSSGQVDTGFSGDGILCDLFNGNSGLSAAGLAIRADGTALAAGSVSGNGQVRAITPAGTFDASFNANGVAAAFPDGRWRSVHVRPDGRILLTGAFYYPATRLKSTMLLPNGQLDSSFGNGGTTELTIAGMGTGTRVTPSVVYPDGRYMMAWGYKTDAPAQERIAVSWFQPGGQPGPIGTVFQDLDNNPSGGMDNVYGMGMAPNGDLIVLGVHDTELGNQLVLLRFKGDLGAPMPVHEHAGGSAPQLFPVPASDRLTIRSNGLHAMEHSQLTVIDMAGRRTSMPVMVNGPEVIMDVSTLAPGTYLLERSWPTGTSRQRFSVVR